MLPVPDKGAEFMQQHLSEVRLAASVAEPTSRAIVTSASIEDLLCKRHFMRVLWRWSAGRMPGNQRLLNRLVGHKVAIVTSRPQTTRNRILGMVNRPNAQVVLIDTPGIHRADYVLGRQMMDGLAQALEGIDVLAVMIDASEGLTREDRLALDRARQFRGPCFCC